MVLTGLLAKPPSLIYYMSTPVCLWSCCLSKHCLLAEGASNTGGVGEMWPGYEGDQSTSGHIIITFDLHPCARSKAVLLLLPPEATPWKNTPLLFFLLQHFHVSFRNTSKLTHSCHSRQTTKRHVGGDAFSLGQGVDLYFRPLLRDKHLNIMIIGN